MAGRVKLGPQGNGAARSCFLRPKRPAAGGQQWSCQYSKALLSLMIFRSLEDKPVPLSGGLHPHVAMMTYGASEAGHARRQQAMRLLSVVGLRIA